MKHPRSVLRMALALLAGGLTAACGASGVSIPKPSQESAVAADAAPASAQQPSQSGPVLMAQVQQLIGQAPCTSDAQCRSLALGARACGGPDMYLAWSATATDSAALQRAADRYTQWQAQANLHSGRMSICVVEVDPGAYCKKPVAGPGRCSLRTDAAPTPIPR